MKYSDDIASLSAWHLRYQPGCKRFRNLWEPHEFRFCWAVSTIQKLTSNLCCKIVRYLEVLLGLLWEGKQWWISDYSILFGFQLRRIEGNFLKMSLMQRNVTALWNKCVGSLRSPKTIQEVSWLYNLFLRGKELGELRPLLFNGWVLILAGKFNLSHHLQMFSRIRFRW